jgi:magnesium transporter
MAVSRSETETRNLDEVVIDLLAEEDLAGLRTLLADEYPQDIADVLERLNEEARFTVFGQLSIEQAAEVLDELGLYATRQLLRQLPLERITALLEKLPPDDVVELLADNIPQRRDEILPSLSPELANEVREALNFPPSSAGRLMTRKFARIQPGMTAEQVLAYARRQIKNKLETLNDFYVLDANNRLEGVVSLIEIVGAPPTRTVDQFMERDLVTVTPDVDQEEAARTLQRYDFLALPVTTEDGRMLGIITVDDAYDVLNFEATEDILKFGGVTISNEVQDQPYFTTPIFRVIRQRFVWLLLLFLADTITGNVLRLFEGELAAVVALSFYIPLLIGTGGNTGAQTVSTIIRGMALDDIQQRDAFKVLLRELLSGLILGTMLGIVGGLRAYSWDQNGQLAIVVGITLVVVCAWSNTIASLIPLVVKRVGIDPAVVSAPLITTLVDATGLFIYLSIARIMLGL